MPTQLRYLNKALQRFEAQFVTPALRAFYALSSIVMGGLFFGEFDAYVGWQYGLFALGIAIMMAGVVVLCKLSTTPESSSRRR